MAATAVETGVIFMFLKRSSGARPVSVYGFSNLESVIQARND